ncbi:hypothetical protein TNCV_1458521 [Trichonephila clavipes]|nr:hypothetical protein TNCV_1458521 [Trichonephila clavipes]
MSDPRSWNLSPAVTSPTVGSPPKTRATSEPQVTDLIGFGMPGGLATFSKLSLFWRPKVLADLLFYDTCCV